MNIPKLFASYSKFIFGEDLKLVIKKQIKSQETNYIYKKKNSGSLYKNINAVQVSAIK